jgi:hypothetical protein
MGLFMSKILDKKLKDQFIGFFIILVLFQNHEIQAEMIIGTGSIEPGVDLIFEGGVKDEIMPEEYYLSENETDVHIEVLANWSSDAPKGSPEGGHVAYLNITAVLINETTGSSDTHKLTPHVNMSDNLHYAKNIKLPGKIDESYTVILKYVHQRMMSLECTMTGDIQLIKNSLLQKDLSLIILILKKSRYQKDARLKRFSFNGIK